MNIKNLFCPRTTNRNWIAFLIVCLITFMTGLISNIAMANSITNKWPDKKWNYSTPKSEKLNPDKVNSFLNKIENGEFGNVNHFLLIRNGQIIAEHINANHLELYKHIGQMPTEPSKSERAEQYNYQSLDWYPFYKETNLHTLQSVTKAVLSLVVGIALDEKHLTSVKESAMGYFEDITYERSDPLKLEITIEDLLTMRTGIDWHTEGGYANEQHSTVEMENSEHWLEYILNRPMEMKPGVKYDYNDGASVLLGKVIAESTGESIREYAAKKLFSPIGINNFYWKVTSNDITDTEGGLYLSTHDLARIGYLILNDGVWQGKQVISKDWLKSMLTRAIEDIYPNRENVDLGYGFQWYILDANGTELYLAVGFGGQYMVLSKKHNLLMVTNSWNINSQVNFPIHRYFSEVFIPSLE